MRRSHGWHGADESSPDLGALSAALLAARAGGAGERRSAGLRGPDARLRAPRAPASPARSPAPIADEGDELTYVVTELPVPRRQRLRRVLRWQRELLRAVRLRGPRPVHRHRRRRPGRHGHRAGQRRRSPTPRRSAAPSTSARPAQRLPRACSSAVDCEDRDGDVSDGLRDRRPARARRGVVAVRHAQLRRPTMTMSARDSLHLPRRPTASRGRACDRHGGDAPTPRRSAPSRAR